MKASFFRNKELYFETCINNKKNYLHQSYIDPFIGFDEADFNLYYESIAPINIFKQYGTVIIANNTF